MIVTLVLRLHPDRLAVGEVAGHAELAASGARAEVGSVADLVRFARRALEPARRAARAVPAEPGPERALRELGLTRRQAQVLALVAEGRSAAQAGLALGISPRTVEKHMEGVRRRLGARGRTACVRLAHRAWAEASARPPW